jgi:hypothetical protein
MTKLMITVTTGTVDRYSWNSTAGSVQVKASKRLSLPNGFSHIGWPEYGWNQISYKSSPGANGRTSWPIRLDPDLHNRSIKIPGAFDDYSIL